MSHDLTVLLVAPDWGREGASTTALASRTVANPDADVEAWAKKALYSKYHHPRHGPGRRVRKIVVDRFDWSVEFMTGEAIDGHIAYRGDGWTDRS